MNNQPPDVTQLADDATVAAFSDARAAYLEVWNMDGPNDARLLHNGLMAVQGILQVDVFYRQGIAVVIYNHHQITPAQLCWAVEQIGRDTLQFFSAEIIGESSASEALQPK